MQIVSERSRWSRADAYGAIIILSLALLLWAPRLKGPIDLRFDAGVYYVLGTSLAECRGYRLLNEPGAIEAVQYPPLLPLVVTAHQTLLGTSDYLVVGPWLRIFYFALSVSVSLAVYGMARLDLAPGPALLAALLCALSLHMYYLSDLLYTEIPFALVTTLFCVAQRSSGTIASALATGVTAVAAFLLRTAGLALLIAWVGEALLRRRVKTAAVRAAVAIIPVALWQAHIARVTASYEFNHPAYAYQRAAYLYSNVSYAENTRLRNPFAPEYGELTATQRFERVATNLLALPGSLTEAMTVPLGFWKWPLRQFNAAVGTEVMPQWLAAGLTVVLGCVLLGLLALGGVRLVAAGGGGFIPLYVAVAVGLACLTPWPEQFPRYLCPLMPFLTLLLVKALPVPDVVFRPWCPRRWQAGKAFSRVLVTVLFFLQGLGLLAAFRGGHNRATYYDACGHATVASLFFYDARWRSLDTALEWVRRRAGPEDVIATTVPQTAYLRTGLRTVMPPLEVDREKALGLLDSVPVKYAVLDELEYPGISPRYAAPAVESAPDRWVRVYVAPEGGARVYERKP
jgi:hypothetical protein